MDEFGGALNYTGEYRDRAMRFEGWTLGAKGDTVLQKLTFFNVAPDTVRQLFETSNDRGKSWQPNFDGRSFAPKCACGDSVTMSTMRSVVAFAGASLFGRGARYDDDLTLSRVRPGRSRRRLRSSTRMRGCTSLFVSEVSRCDAVVHPRYRLGADAARRCSRVGARVRVADGGTVTGVGVHSLHEGTTGALDSPRRRRRSRARDRPASRHSTRCCRGTAGETARDRRLAVLSRARRGLDFARAPIRPHDPATFEYSRRRNRHPARSPLGLPSRVRGSRYRERPPIESGRSWISAQRRRCWWPSRSSIAQSRSRAFRSSVVEPLGAGVGGETRYSFVRVPRIALGDADDGENRRDHCRSLGRRNASLVT